MGRFYKVTFLKEFPLMKDWSDEAMEGGKNSVTCVANTSRGKIGKTFSLAEEIAVSCFFWPAPRNVVGI